MDHGVISGASPCGSVCKWEHRTAWQETASQNPFRDKNWPQEEQPSQVLDFRDKNQSCRQIFLPQAVPTGLTLLSKEVSTQCLLARCSCREAPGMLSWHTMAWQKQKSTHGKPVPWKMPAVIPAVIAVRLSNNRAMQPGSAQPGNNLCHEIFSHSEHIAVQLGDREELCASLSSSEKWQPKPEPSQMVPFSATRDKQIF